MGGLPDGGRYLPAALALCLASLPAHGDEPLLVPAELGDAALLDLRDQIAGELARSAPVTVVGIRSGFGQAPGLLSFGGALTNLRDRQFDDWDASLTLTYGFGDDRAGVGVTLTADITSVSPFHFGQSGKLNLALTRRFGPEGVPWTGSVAIGAENLAPWGDSEALETDYFAAFSWHRQGSLETPPLMVSLGYGTGVSGGGYEPGLFGGIGVGLGQNSAASLAWNGDEAIAALTIWPDWPAGSSLSIGVGDLTNTLDARRVIIGASWSFDLRSLGR